MATEIQLRIVTPRSGVMDESVLEVTGPGTLGEFGILPNHAAFLTSLETGCLSYRDSRGLHRLAIREGFAEVANNVMTVLVEAAQRAEQIDPVAAEADLRSADARLKDASPADPDYPLALNEKRWAEARIAAARKH
jgi:F-type H+-transporting ATPase subunit epsilon